MRAGPKRAATLERLDVSDLPRHRGARACAFIERHVRLPKDRRRRRLRVRTWQRGIIHGALAPGVRQGLVSMARGNGKSTLSAALALYLLHADNVEGAQVLLISATERQSLMLFNIVRRMTELDPDLVARSQTHVDRIYVPATDSTLLLLPRREDGLYGWDPSAAIVDELHLWTAAEWEAITTAAGKRERSLVLALSTAASSKDSVMWDLTEHGRTGDDPQFCHIEHAAPDGCALDDEEAIRAANPAHGDFLDPAGLEATRKTTREPTFRRLRLNQHVEGVGSWLPWGAWEEREEQGRVIDPEEPIVIGFDGSISDDSTALIGCTVNAPHHLFELATWDTEEGRIPRREVHEAVASAFATYDVRELACDPYRWESDIEEWSRRHGQRVLHWPTNSIPRMAPATDRLRSAVMEGTISHDGSEVLARHVRNATVKSTSHGDVIVKDRRGSPRKIDAAVAAIVAHDRAAWHAANPPRPRRRRMAVIA